MTTASQDRQFLTEVVGTRLLEEAIDWIKNNLEPEDVFSDEKLHQWATNNDYVIPDDE
jgi:hypothetical protein